MSNTGAGPDQETGEEVALAEIRPGKEKETGGASENPPEEDDRDEPQPKEEQAEEEVREPAGEEPSGGEPDESDEPPQSEEGQQTEDGAENGPKPEEGDTGEGENQNQKPEPQPGVAFRWSSWLKGTDWTERWQLIKLTVGLGVGELLVFLIGFVSTFMCGKLGSAEHASASLAIVLFDISVVYISIGLAQTFNTLISQTHGSGNLLRVGVLLQRGMLFAGLSCFLSWSVLLCAEPIALRLGQTREAARMTQHYVYILMPAVPACYMYQLQVKFLQNQEWFKPQLIAGVCANILNAMINYIMTYLHLNFLWSAAATLLSHCFSAVLLFVIIKAEGFHKPTWPGWSLDCLQEWGSFSVVAFLSVLMVTAEFWVIEGWLYIASWRGVAIFEAQMIIYYIYIAFVTIPLGLSAAASVQIGNALGVNNVDKAKRSCAFSAQCAFVLMGVYATAVFFLIQPIAALFTEDQEIMAMLSKDHDIIVFVLALGIDCLAHMVGGMFRGVGKLGDAIVCILVGQVIGILLSNELSKRQGILGIGGGFLWGLGIQLVLYCGPIYRLVSNWQLLAKEAQVTAGVKKEELENLNAEPSDADAQSEQPAQVRGTTVVGEVLTQKQLIQRRGSLLFLVWAIFIMAIVVRHLTMKMYSTPHGYRVLSA